MNPGRFDTLSKFRAVHLDAKQATYEMWFAWKRLNRKVRRVWRASKVGSAWLPQELVDHIVDYVSDDGPTLFACTHLSRTWCIAARAHLYRTFTVSDYFGFEAIDDLQSMGIIDLVRKVVAVRKVNWQADFLTPSTMERLHTFTRVQELDIRYLDVGAPLLWLHEHGDILRSTVRFLTLRYPRGSIKEIACFIGSFPKLEDLTVDGIGVDIFRDSQVPAIRRSLPFTGRLTLMRISDQEFPSALSTSMQNGVGFRTVDLQLCVEMQELVDACAGTMERLICHPSDFHGLENLDLSRCDSLRHVEVNFRAMIHAFPNHVFYDFISTIPSPRLETCLIVNYNNDLDDLRRTLRATPKSKEKLMKEEAGLERDVKITFGLEIGKEGAEDHRESIDEALSCAIRGGTFKFSKRIPTLEVLVDSGCQTA